MDRYELVIRSEDPDITVTGTWAIIAAVLQSVTKMEYTLHGVAHIEVKRV